MNWQITLPLICIIAWGSSCSTTRVSGNYIHQSFQTRDTLSFEGDRYQLKTGSHFYRGFSSGFFKVKDKRIIFFPDTAYLFKAWISDSLQVQSQKSDTRIIIDDFGKYREDFDIFIEYDGSNHKFESDEYILPSEARRFRIVARHRDHMAYLPPYYNEQLRSNQIDLNELGNFYSSVKLTMNLKRSLLLFIKLDDYIIGRDGIRPVSARFFEKE